MRRPLIAIVCSTLGSALASGPALAAGEMTGPSETIRDAQTGGAGLAIRAPARTPADRGALYVLKGRRLRLLARSRALEPGRMAMIEIAAGRRLTRLRAPVRPVAGGGEVAVSLTPRQSGPHRLSARLERASEGEGGSRSAQAPPILRADRVLYAVEPRAGRGARGMGIRLLQRRLRSLGFDVPLHGVFDAATDRAVLAFRKTSGMARTGFADSRVFSMLFRGAGGFRLRYPFAGKHAEFDWSRQVLVLAERGRPRFVYHVSSGAPATPTVFGTFRFYRKQPGVNSHGMVHSNYFIRGYAIHGYASVPTFPASHGCIRVPIPNSGWIDRWIRLGEPIFTYR